MVTPVVVPEVKVVFSVSVPLMVVVAGNTVARAVGLSNRGLTVSCYPPVIEALNKRVTV